MHDISAIEPSLKRPDAFLEVPTAERTRRTHAGDDFCVIRSRDGAERRYFVRVLIPVLVHDMIDPCCWGTWCEVSGADYESISRLWNDPAQCDHPAMSATLANDIPGYPPTVGLAGKVRFVDRKQIPHFGFAAAVDHPFVAEVRSGVGPARVLEWLAPWLHGAGVN
jgi:hypothetical protein